MSAPASPLLGGSVLQRLRIASGLVLFTFALTHFTNHALGIWSIEAMEGFQAWRTAVNRSLPGTLLLAGAFLTHVTLNLTKVARRSTWRMPKWEALQIALGLTIFALLTYHGAFMRSVHILEGTRPEYSDALPGLWNNFALFQTTLLLLVWTHGCIGLHYWLRLSRHYRSVAPVLFATAVLVPALGLSGFVVAGRDAAADAAARQTAAAASAADDYDSYGGSGASYDEYGGSDDYDSYGTPAPAAPTWSAADIRDYALWVAVALLALVAAIVAARALLRLTRRRIRVNYTAGRSVLTAVGPTLLEISRIAGVPHASVCGGRARCSTCRVKVEEGEEALPPSSPAEAATLQRIHAEPDVRLACQLRPRSDLTVTRLVRPPDERGAVLAAGADEAGVERTLAILFLDIRGFTSLSEARLPYDTVFLLNRFFTEIGEVTNAAGGWIDKYMGDGMMALFGLNQPLEAACRGALVAAMRIDAALERLNGELRGELAAPLRIGIGLHVGPLVLGRIGHHASAVTTVIGPAVNVASRLEGLTKEHGVEIVAASAVFQTAGISGDAFPEVAATVRGTTQPVSVRLVARGRDLTPFLEPEMRRTAA